MNRTTRCAATFVGLACAVSTSTAWAVPLTFNIDSSLSSLSLALQTPDGTTFSTPQFLGGDTTAISGTQVVNVTGNSIQFISTGNVQFALQHEPVAPAVGGSYPGRRLDNTVCWR